MKLAVVIRFIFQKKDRFKFNALWIERTLLTFYQILLSCRPLSFSPRQYFSALKVSFFIDREVNSVNISRTHQQVAALVDSTVGKAVTFVTCSETTLRKLLPRKIIRLILPLCSQFLRTKAWKKEFSKES